MGDGLDRDGPMEIDSPSETGGELEFDDEEPSESPDSDLDEPELDDSPSPGSRSSSIGPEQDIVRDLDDFDYVENRECTYCESRL